MPSTSGVRPKIVAVSKQSGFLHLIQKLFDTIGLPVRTTSDWRGAPGLVEHLRPKLVVLDLVPGQEVECWLALEAIKAHARTQTVPVLLCPVADWLLAGHDARVLQHHVYVWPDSFNLDDLLRSVQAAIADEPNGAVLTPTTP